MNVPIRVRMMIIPSQDIRPSQELSKVASTGGQRKHALQSERAGPCPEKDPSTAGAVRFETSSLAPVSAKT
jgi:hypothetical protein